MPGKNSSRKRGKQHRGSTASRVAVERAQAAVEGLAGSRAERRARRRRARRGEPSE